jgi:voltage-gated potassium channel Kch
MNKASGNAPRNGKPRLRPVAFLLAAQILLLVLVPLDAGTRAPLRSILSTGFVFGMIYLMAGSRRTLLVGIALGIPSVAFKWLGGPVGLETGELVAHTFSLPLDIFVICLMLRWIARSTRVGLETVLLGISSYLMLGFLWYSVYCVVELLTPGLPGAFAIANSRGPEDIWSELYYFSFVTLTTLGYGDIAPITPIARSLAILEAVTGVLFVATMIAMLVGAYSAEASAKRRGSRVKDA